MVGQSLFHGVLATSHAYISFGDHGGDWPSFETGEEPVVANGSLVYVSCADDDIAVDVRASEPDDVDGRQLVYDGPLTVEGVQIGTFMSTNLEPVDAPAGKCHLHIYVDRPSEATSILFICSSS